MYHVSDDDVHSQITQALEYGFVDDRCLYFPGRRFAVPLYDQKGHLIATLCCGAFFEGLNIAHQNTYKKKLSPDESSFTWR